MFDFSIVTNWIHQMLTSFMPEGLAALLECVVIGICIILTCVVLVIILIYMERKICVFFQCRLGSVRVGKWGLFQVPCDVIKMLTKEITDLRFSDRLLHNLTPFAATIASFLTLACLSISKGLEVLDFNVGVFSLLTASSIGVVGILLADQDSNNKFSLTGAMRSGVQIISYELPCGLNILTMIALMGTMQFSGIVAGQADGWFIFKEYIPAMIASVIYLIAGNAKTSHGPFDLSEAESELTAGHHTKYSDMGFGFSYLVEHLNLFIIVNVVAIIFLGGQMPLHTVGLDGFNAVMDHIPGSVWLFGKAFFVVFLLMWIKWTFPCLRIDQILNLEWKYPVLIPMVNLILMVLTVISELRL